MTIGVRFLSFFYTYTHVFIPTFVRTMHIFIPTFGANSRWDRYLGMTAPMTQVPVPTATKVRTYSENANISEKKLS